LGQQKLEFKEMVRAFHSAGIEVILDVVFNHTGRTPHGLQVHLRGIGIVRIAERRSYP